jgi:hypothetical protein
MWDAGMAPSHVFGKPMTTDKQRAGDSTRPVFLLLQKRLELLPHMHRQREILRLCKEALLAMFRASDGLRRKQGVEMLGVVRPQPSLNPWM